MDHIASMVTEVFLDKKIHSYRTAPNTHATIHNMIIHLHRKEEREMREQKVNWWIINDCAGKCSGISEQR